jgi:RNA polymerase sigma-70 factor (ECF subfamily)
MDVCQSVLASFFVRAASGNTRLRRRAVALLLVGIAHKVAFQARKERAECRDNRRVEAGVRQEDLAARDATPSRHAAAGELLREVHRRLTAEELELVELRSQGLGWGEIARRLGGSAEALRKKLTRALNRVARALDLDDLDSE